MSDARVPDPREDRSRTDLSVRSADEEGTTIGSEPERGVFDRVDVFFRDLGPGLITGCADDDPSGISTYSIAGAGFGYGMLWTALLSFPLMVSVQMMCSRLGMVTGRGLASVIRMHYPRFYAVLTGAMVGGLAIDFLGLDAVKMMFWSAVVNGALAPPLILLMILFQYGCKQR
jgi:Mn2+/Fe2+ NRAMP family transporter